MNTLIKRHLAPVLAALATVALITACGGGGGAGTAETGPGPGDGAGGTSRALVWGSSAWGESQFESQTLP